MMLAVLALVLLLLVGGAVVLLRRKHVAHWVAPAAAYRMGNWFVGRARPVHVLLAVADHWEPSLDGAGEELAAQRVARWVERWPEVAAAHRDADGCPPRHTWFYPWDEWRDGEVAALGRLCYDGLGEVELHLHHDRDTSERLRVELLRAREAFAQHGALLLCGDPTQPAYGFVHGDWALDNSRSDGQCCGVNDELIILAQTGCYADFTLPTPDSTQPRLVNRIYRATDNPRRPRSHDRGAPLTAGRRAPGDLLLIPGPLGFNLRDWHHGWYPAIEQGELAAPSPVCPVRSDFWVRTGVGVRGRRDWVFVKLHTHGCRERDVDEVLGEARHRLHRLLAQRYNDGERCVLHYCTARELANIALAAEEGLGGDPGTWRDHRLPPPVNSVLLSAGSVAVARMSAARGEIVALAPGEVRWELRLGPVACLTGPVRRLAWDGDAVTVEADGAYRLTRRA
jgi:hypothetical protein